MEEEKRLKDGVREAYAEIARQQSQCCCSSSCCGAGGSAAVSAGYLPEELQRVPQEAVMGLGCGSPTAVAEIKEGEVVVDLGAGPGVDAFLAANKVGPNGKVIGVDMTAEMVDKANGIARTHGYSNVEFRLGELEALPVDTGSADLVISNCVINLCPDKGKAFREACRVLRPGGRLIVADIVSEKPLAAELREDLGAWASCIGGALERQAYLAKIEEAGFENVDIMSERPFFVEVGGGKAMEQLMSVTVKAYKLAL